MFGGKGDVCLFIIEYTSWLSGFHCHGERQWETLFKTSVSCGEQPAQESLPRLPFCTPFFLWHASLMKFWTITHIFVLILWFSSEQRLRTWPCEWIWRTNVDVKEPLHPSFCLVPEANCVWIIWVIKTLNDHHRHQCYVHLVFAHFTL